VIGTTLSHYRIVEKLGEGGMGEVYLAEDTRLERKIALKVLPSEMADEPDRLARFEREAKALAALNHPNIVTIHSVEEADGVRFFTMELVEGKTLAELTPEGGLPLKGFFELAVPLADALSAAHGKGVTHRDLKPTNVMITDEGRVKVLDFGLAKVTDKPPMETDTTTDAVTGDGQVVGTVPYMSPEQLQGREIDFRSDVFSLGILLYEMLTGRRPFAGDSSADVISSILRDTPSTVSEVRSDLPRHLGRIIRHCLEKDPERRYQATKDIRNDLEDLKREVDSGEVAAAMIPAAAPTEAARTYRTALVGRDVEHAELTALLEQAQNGQGSLVMIGGESGVGKTRLVWELYTEARERGFLALIGHCYEMEGSPPLIPWVEVLETVARIAPRETLRELLGDAAPEVAKLLPELRRLFPDIPPPLELPPEESRRYLFKCIREFVERSSREQPLLLVLEDLHWADTATLLLLQTLAPHLNEMPVLIVGTYRDVELDVARPLAKTLRELVRERLARRIALRRLSQDAVAEMLAELAGQTPPLPLIDAIFTETEGNPFFVEEVYQHLDEQGRLFDADGNWLEDLSIEDLDVPEGVRLVVGRRLEQLTDEGRTILASAAVIGRNFDFELLESLADVDPDTLLDTVEDAERLRLLDPVAGSGSRQPRYSFAHELIRQTLIGGLSFPRRQRVHLKVAEAIERTYPSDLESHASDLAHHLYNAGAAADPDKTVQFLTLAGDQAVDAGGFEDAVHHYDNALSLLEAGETRERAHLLNKRGAAFRRLGRGEDALRDWREAVAISERLGDLEAVAHTCSDMAYLLAWEARVQESLEIAQRGLDAAGDEPTAIRCRLLGQIGFARGMTGDYREGAGQLSQVLAHEEPRGRGSRSASGRGAAHGRRCEAARRRSRFHTSRPVVPRTTG
jgi:tetratricopeptide (TPR) repeat protein